MPNTNRTAPTDTNRDSPENIPIGAIMMWPGIDNQLPSNWMICDGKSLLKRDYSVLQSRLGKYWNKDSGDSSDYFNLPDLRGVFLRGVNAERADAFRDPDVANRIRVNSDTTNTLNRPGTFQTSANLTHYHGLIVGGGSNGPREAISIDTHWDAAYNNKFGASHTAEAGGTESRPVNAYVYYIIKVK
ncbi:phage tail protein [Aquirhabdus parva]|uniref:Tail fiber protein n=1 Tax=Aquirhabdus parva TaxID=2283318 RepID=A0A345P698_9GAMM|nr:tail fiber protein [Aquirhabdus parva]AXI02807.1 tail fiber protein [Aquirhabdus parva]